MEVLDKELTWLRFRDPKCMSFSHIRSTEWILSSFTDDQTQSQLYMPMHAARMICQMCEIIVAFTSIV